jgi:hypothetical protein
VKGDTDVAHVHVGKHSHAINVAVSQEVRERFAAHAIRAAAKDPHLTPARYIQCRAREAIFARMKDDAAFDNGNLEE